MNVAEIREGAVDQSMGPFPHAAVPAGELASQIPREIRVGCEGKCNAPFFIVSSNPADDQYPAPIPGYHRTSPQRGRRLTLCDCADRLAIDAPHNALRVPVDGVLVVLLDASGRIILNLAKDAPERALVARARRVHVRLPVRGVAAEKLDINLVALIRYIAPIHLIATNEAKKKRVPMRIAAVTTPGTTGAASVYVTRP